MALHILVIRLCCGDHEVLAGTQLVKAADLLVFVPTKVFFPDDVARFVEARHPGIKRAVVRRAHVAIVGAGGPADQQVAVRSLDDGKTLVISAAAKGAAPERFTLPVKARHPDVFLPPAGAYVSVRRGGCADQGIPAVCGFDQVAELLRPRTAQRPGPEYGALGGEAGDHHIAVLAVVFFAQAIAGIDIARQHNCSIRTEQHLFPQVKTRSARVFVPENDLSLCGRGAEEQRRPQPGSKQKKEKKTVHACAY